MLPLKVMVVENLDEFGRSDSKDDLLKRRGNRRENGALVHQEKETITVKGHEEI